MHQRGNTELPCRAPLSYWIPLRNGPSGSVIIENLHKYKLHRKQVGLLPEGDHQGRPLAHTTKRLARVMAQKSCSACSEPPILANGLQPACGPPLAALGLDFLDIQGSYLAMLDLVQPDGNFPAQPLQL